MPLGLLLITVLSIGLVPQPAHAILPPDLIFSVGSSVVQFFSIIALVVGGVFSSIVYTSRRWLALSPARVWLVIVAIFLLVGLVIGVVYVVELNKQQTAYQDHISILEQSNAELENQMHNSVPLADYQQLLAQASNQSSFWYPNITVSTSSVAGFTREFHGDNIILYAPGDTSSFALELDMNRIESTAGVYTHYTYLTANLFGEPVTDYASVYSTLSDLQPNRFVERIERTVADDLSPRDTYEATVLIGGEPLSFTVTGLQGDFITRHQPTYLQYQSVGEAEVTYQGKTFTAQALVERAYATDYTKQIFFPGYQEVDSTTHQFILWDEEENFYLIDVSDVRSNTPEYPSHVWLLYKDATEQGSKKSFVAEVTTETDDSGRVTWNVSAPEFSNATFTLSPVVPYKQTGDDRIRTAVGGVVQDGEGERTVGGVLHLVK